MRSDQLNIMTSEWKVWGKTKGTWYQMCLEVSLQTRQRAALHPKRAPCTGRVLMTSWEDKKNDGQDGPHARDVCWRQGRVLGQGDKNNDDQENKRAYKQGNKRIRGQDTKCNIATKTDPMQGRTKTTGQEQRWTREHQNQAPMQGTSKMTRRQKLRWTTTCTTHET